MKKFLIIALLSLGCQTTRLFEPKEIIIRLEPSGNKERIFIDYISVMGDTTTFATGKIQIIDDSLKRFDHLREPPKEKKRNRNKRE